MEEPKKQLTLGEFAEILRKFRDDHGVPGDAKVVLDDNTDDDEYVVGLESCRSIYEHLAVDHSAEDTWAKDLDWLINECGEAREKIYDGWRGGSYHMGRDTPIWVAPNGDPTRRALVGATLRKGLLPEHDDWSVVLDTKQLEMGSPLAADPMFAKKLNMAYYLTGWEWDEFTNFDKELSPDQEERVRKALAVQREVAEELMKEIGEEWMPYWWTDDD